MMQSYRLTIRLVSLIALIVTPVLELYGAILNYIPDGLIGKLYYYADDLAQVIPLDLTGGYFSWLLVLFDRGFGLLGLSRESVQSLLAGIHGSFWSITVGGITVADPLAYLQTLASGQSVSSGFAIAAVIPVVLALIFGRFFCSWICPVSTIHDMTRFITRKLRVPKAKRELVTNHHLRFYLLAAGLVMPFLGLVVFPYIMPYVLLGRFFYNLTVGRLFLETIGILSAIIVVDTFLQKGFWCNYLCPSGLMLAILGKRRLINIKYNASVCWEGCSHCSSSCSWQADPRVKYSLNCTNCGKCIETCPSGALGYTRQEPNTEAEQIERAG